jgi:hypothetical protein
MTTARHIVALLQSHVAGDEDRFLSVAIQLAAHEARQGHGKLAQELRLLTAVWVPDVAHEAMRDLIRARQAAVRAVRVVRQQLSAFLLRHERIYPEGRRTCLDEGASRMAGRPELRSLSAADRAGGEYRSGAAGRTAAGSR